VVGWSRSRRRVLLVERGGERCRRLLRSSFRMGKNVSRTSVKVTAASQSKSRILTFAPAPTSCSPTSTISSHSKTFLIASSSCPPLMTASNCPRTRLLFVPYALVSVPTAITLSSFPFPFPFPSFPTKLLKSDSSAFKASSPSAKNSGLVPATPPHPPSALNSSRFSRSFSGVPTTNPT
jgi:hypothetical protein